jgi:hypothetical protein
VVTLTATDQDFGSNGQISYRFGSGSRDNFLVYDNGTVVVSAFPNFDYDEYKQLTVQV